MLILGDAVHAEDVECLNLALGGSNAIDAALRTAEKLNQLSARLTCPATAPLPATKAFGVARSRYEQMRVDPQRVGRHACKRIFALALMIHEAAHSARSPATWPIGRGLSATPLRCSARTRRL